MTPERINELANEAMESIDTEDGELYAFARCAIENVIERALAEDRVTVSDIHGRDAAHRSLIDRMKADADGRHCPSVGAWIDHLQSRARLAEHERDEAMVHVAKLGLERDDARQQLAAIHAVVNTDAESMTTLDYVNDLKSEVGGLADALDKCMRERDEARAEVESLKTQLAFMESPPFTRRRLKVERDQAVKERDAYARDCGRLSDKVLSLIEERDAKFPDLTQRDRRIAELEEKLSVSFNCPRCQTAIMLQPDAPAQPADDFLAAVHSARAKLADAGVNLNAAEFMAEGAPAQPIISKSMAKRLAIMEEAASERSKSADSGQMRPQTESTTDLGVESIVSQLREIITDQANDEGLWFDADRAPEAYLQRSLRDLHGVVERAIAGLTPKEHCPRRLMGEHQEPHMPCDAGDFSRGAQPATKDAQLVRDAMADPKTTPWEEFKAKRGLDEVENDAAEALILAGVSSKRTGRMVYDAAPPSPAGSAKNATQKEASVVGDRSEKRSDKEAHDGGNSSSRDPVEQVIAAYKKLREHFGQPNPAEPHKIMTKKGHGRDQSADMIAMDAAIAALDAAREGK